MSEIKHPPTVRLAVGADNQTPHHWVQGPQDVHPSLSVQGAWMFRYYIDVVKGTTRTTAARAIKAVLTHPLSWQRTGVTWKRTYKRADADILVSVIPQDTSVCGPGSAGCYSWDSSSTPKAELGVEHIDDPNAFAELVNMELCGHGTFRMSDMYSGDGHDSANYVGVMGTWGGSAKSHYYPSDAEIADAKLWLAGQAPIIHPNE